MSEVGRLADQLEAVVAELDDLAFSRLRTAVADGATVRPAGDKELAQARRAVEKALRILQRLDAAGIE
jgi:hypothetical protein